MEHPPARWKWSSDVLQGLHLGRTACIVSGLLRVAGGVLVSARKKQGPAAMCAGYLCVKGEKRTYVAAPGASTVPTVVQAERRAFPFVRAQAKQGRVRRGYSPDAHPMTHRRAPSMILAHEEGGKETLVRTRSESSEWGR